MWNDLRFQSKFVKVIMIDWRQEEGQEVHLSKVKCLKEEMKQTETQLRKSRCTYPLLQQSPHSLIYYFHQSTAVSPT
jgi:hypothetical protein